MLRQLLVCQAVLLAGIHAQEASFPLESVSVEGTTILKQSVMEIAGLRLGAPVNKAVIVIRR